MRQQHGYKKVKRDSMLVLAGMMTHVGTWQDTGKLSSVIISVAGHMLTKAVTLLEPVRKIQTKMCLAAL